ncbi:MarR family winged helix-turn-helix transcriptional regulator [Aquihabitans sp. McL0605]|uniref:MarR family winged helix-turn-helix transcriptional regulator n=1 Tax=Aquihabitans sp. McL0605 TaxID=3415671 RepID=UPI003CF16A67
MGLLLETHAGVRSAIEPDLEIHGLNGSAFEVLVRLARSPMRRLRMTELAGQSTLSNSGLTRVIDRLTDAGLVSRAQHDGDRRVYYAVITPRGLSQLLAALPSHLHTVDKILTDVLSADELHAFETALRKIRSVVKPDADPDIAASA